MVYGGRIKQVGILLTSLITVLDLFEDCVRQERMSSTSVPQKKEGKMRIRAFPVSLITLPGCWHEVV